MAGSSGKSGKSNNAPSGGGTITASAVSSESSKVSDARNALNASSEKQKAIAANAMANATTPRQKRIAEIMANTNTVEAMRSGKDVYKTLKRSNVIDNAQALKSGSKNTGSGNRAKRRMGGNPAGGGFTSFNSKQDGSLKDGLSRLSTVEKRAKANKKAAETRAANKAKRGKVSDAFAVPNSRR